MKRKSILILLCLAFSLLDNSSINAQTKNTNQILKNKMERDYKRILKTLNVAKKIKSNGGVIDIERAIIKLKKLKGKDPTFDTSEADSTIASFNADSFDYDSWKKL